MDTCWIVNPELPDRYRSITPWGLIPAAEECDLKSFQGGFESHSPYQIIFSSVHFLVYIILKMYYTKNIRNERKHHDSGNLT